MEAFFNRELFKVSNYREEQGFYVTLVLGSFLVFTCSPCIVPVSHISCFGI